MSALLEMALGDAYQPWRQVARNDQRARELSDRHYSRQTPGASEFMGSGWTFVLLAQYFSRFDAEANGKRAVWGAIQNRAPGTTEWRLRCSIFRNETPWISSYLVTEATRLTQERWHRRFGWLNNPPLTTEVDPDKTRRKRDPGRCFRKAGWRVIDPDRNGLVVLQAPDFIPGDRAC